MSFGGSLGVSVQDDLSKRPGRERGPVAVAWERSQKLALGKLVRERTVASCGWLAPRLKMRSVANKKTGMEKPDEQTAENAR
jgi:hypothetical protein